MKCVLSCEELMELLNHQLKTNWGKMGEQNCLNSDEDFAVLSKALGRLEQCFEKVKSPYFHSEQGEVVFKIDHSVQYAIFLYFLSNEMHRAGKEQKASFLYYLNKMMNSVEWFYSVNLPCHFCAEHPLGTILGKASYGDYLFVYQGVTVGGNISGGGKIYYPILEDHVTLMSDSKVIGNCHIGRNVIISANTYIKDTNIPDNTIVFGEFPNLTIKNKREDKIKQWSEHIWLS